MCASQFFSGGVSTQEADVIDAADQDSGCIGVGCQDRSGDLEALVAHAAARLAQDFLGVQVGQHFKDAVLDAVDALFGQFADGGVVQQEDEIGVSIPVIQGVLAEPGTGQLACLIVVYAHEGGAGSGDVDGDDGDAGLVELVHHGWHDVLIELELDGDVDFLEHHGIGVGEGQVGIEVVVQCEHLPAQRGSFFLDPFSGHGGELVALHHVGEAQQYRPLSCGLRFGCTLGWRFGGSRGLGGGWRFGRRRSRIARSNQRYEH